MLAIVAVMAFVLVRIFAVRCYWSNHLDDVELCYGLVGREFSQGPILSISDYQFDASEGGYILTGAILGAVFTFVGPNYGALKLVAILCGLAAMLIWFALIKRAFGRTTALWFLAAGVLIPPGLLISALWLNGKWTFPDVIHGLGLLLLCSLIESNGSSSVVPKNERTVITRLLGLGFVAGIGIYLSNYFFIMASYVFLAVCCQRILNSPARIGAFFSGLLVGASPWIAYNLQHDFGALSELRWGAPGSKVYFHTAASATGWIWDSSLNFGGRIINLIAFWWPNSWLEGGTCSRIAGILLGRVYELIVLAGAAVVLLCMRRPRSDPERSFGPVSAYPPGAGRSGYTILGFFAFVILVTGFSRIGIPSSDFPNYRYLMPLLPFYLLTIAVFFDRMTTSRLKSLRAAAWMIAIVLCVLLLVCNRAVLFGRAPGRLLHRTGYDYGVLGVAVAQRAYYKGELNDALVLAEGIKDRQDRDDFLGYIADMYWFVPFCERCSPAWVHMGREQFEIVDVEAFEKSTREKIAVRYHPLLYRALGHGFAWSHGSNLKAIEKLAGALGVEESRYAWQGVGSVEAWKRGGISDWLLPTLRNVPEKWRKPFCEGVGAVWGYLDREKACAFEELLRGLPADVREDCLRGRDIGFIREPFSRLAT